MAAASGLTLVPEGNLNPMETTTLGTGELMMHALSGGCTRVLIGIGGSATNDGGIGFGLRAFCNAELRNGIELVLHETDIEESMRSSVLVITGEGRIDRQTGCGKVPVGVARLAKKYGLPVIAIAGSIGEGTEDLYKCGIDAIVCTTDAPMKLSEAMIRAPELIENAALRTWKLLQVRL